ncbi:uncharacterized protein METZ01_LOCUS135322, partial [marine metagenome]
PIWEELPSLHLLARDALTKTSKSRWLLQIICSGLIYSPGGRTSF